MSLMLSLGVSCRFSSRDCPSSVERHGRRCRRTGYRALAPALLRRAEGNAGPRGCARGVRLRQFASVRGGNRASCPEGCERFADTDASTRRKGGVRYEHRSGETVLPVGELGKFLSERHENVEFAVLP